MSERFDGEHRMHRAARDAEGEYGGRRVSGRGLEEWEDGQRLRRREDLGRGFERLPWGDRGPTRDFDRERDFEDDPERDLAGASERRVPHARGEHGRVDPYATPGHAVGQGGAYGPTRRWTGGYAEPRAPERFERGEFEGSRGGYGSGDYVQQGGWHGGREFGRHAGRGPKGYQRSDERIREDVCDRLTCDPEVDASDLTVQVQSGDVTLEGTVDDRWMKRRAEDCIADVPGVRQVHNRLHVGPASAGIATRSADKEDR